MKKILITGGCGFIGSNLAVMLREKYPGYTVYAFDNLKRRGSELNIGRLTGAGATYIHGDIRNKADLERVPEVDCIIDAAAEPSVMAGYKGDLEYVIDTNLNGTINTLLFASRQKADFIFLSTSRVYPVENINSISLYESTERFTIAENQYMQGITPSGISEDFPVAGTRTLYGASKLASELFIHEFREQFGLKTVINRCGVIAGPWQMGKVDQGVAVLWMARHFWKKELGYIGFGGTGKQVRDILHVKDLFELIDWEMHNMESVNSETFNVGGGLKNSVSLLEMTTICEKITGNSIKITSVPETRKGDVMIYITDNSRISLKSGWKPKSGLDSIFGDIYSWIRENKKTLSDILNF